MSSSSAAAIVKEEDSEDNIVCAVCMEADSYEDDEIVFCDKCDLAVHQSCYGINDVPSASWFCDPCTSELDPATLPCELCCFTGGAYKPATGQNKWVHSICYIWLPEPKAVDIGRGKMAIEISEVDRQRTKLHCSLCDNENKACIQCSYRTCLVAAHPWCVMHVGNQNGFGYAIDAGTMYCHRHRRILLEAQSNESDSLIQQQEFDHSSKKRRKQDQGWTGVKRKEVLSRETPVDASLIGLTICKDFPEYGTYQGYIVSYDAPYYLIEYPADGDKEELTRQEILPLLLRR